ncbi:hypothetical protein [Desulfocurvus sp.]|jgi:hypothetical protein|uniref:hypothetical protein n=1 Tax=Desulfocurvus sp. TaxID=2871698 RepID=UPI0025BD2290|nr:hypothetical protein [Desulfocurvus sp.]MCK9240926.1 hypothetical protein [Desulfocurvus sp.]
MDPTTLIPATEPYQVQWWIFQALLSLGFLVHILLVNVMLGTTVMALVAGLGGKDDPPARAISTKLPTTIAFTVNFGVVPLLFLQVLYGHFFYISDIIMGWFWLSVPFLVMFAYYMAYLFDFRYERLGQARTLVLLLAAACMTAVAFFFVNNLTMFLTPDRWLTYFENDRGTVLNWADPSLLPRVSHFLLASLAVGGLAVALLWSRGERAARPGAQAHVRRGMRWFLLASVAQLAVGPWFLLTIRHDVMLLFLGGGGAHTAFFAAAMLGVAAVLYAGLARRPGLGAVAVVFTAAMMVGVRELMRISYLEDFYRAWEVPSRGEYSPLAMFLVALVLGIGVVAYVLKLARNAGKEA